MKSRSARRDTHTHWSSRDISIMWSTSFVPALALNLLCKNPLVAATGRAPAPPIIVRASHERTRLTKAIIRSLLVLPECSKK